MPAKKKPLRVPQTPLVSIVDALASICSTVDVAASALARDASETLAVNAAQVLHEHVYGPIAKAKAAIQEHVDCRQEEGKAIYREFLVKQRRRKKRAPNGSRKGKRRQRNRWKDRQAALKPWERQTKPRTRSKR